MEKHVSLCDGDNNVRHLSLLGSSWTCLVLQCTHNRSSIYIFCYLSLFTNKETGKFLLFDNKLEPPLLMTGVLSVFLEVCSWCTDFHCVYLILYQWWRGCLSCSLPPSVNYFKHPSNSIRWSWPSLLFLVCIALKVDGLKLNSYLVVCKC